MRIEKGAAILGLLIILALGYFEWRGWQECRQTHTFFFCMRVMGK